MVEPQSPMSKENRLALPRARAAAKEARRRFGSILTDHLFVNFRRPAGSLQRAWSLEEFVERLSMAPDDSVTTLQTVRDWLKGISLPDEKTTFPKILQLLFGEESVRSERRSWLEFSFARAIEAEKRVFVLLESLRSDRHLRVSIESR